MRLIFHNPQGFWYKSTLSHFLNRKKSPDKYEHLFDYAYKLKRIYVYIDKTNPAFIYPPALELIIWILINKLNPFKFRIIRKLEELHSDDVLISFLYEHFNNQSGKFGYPRKRLIKAFKNCKAFKVIHLTHYGYNVDIGARNAQSAGIDLFVSENNLFKNSQFFRQFFKWYEKDVYALPFVPKARFVKSNKFGQRINKAIATGTITLPMNDRHFIEFFNDDKLQPMRNEIYKNSNGIKNYIDSYITDIKDFGFLENETTSLMNVFSRICIPASILSSRNIDILKYFINYFVIYPFRIIRLARRKTTKESIKMDRNYYKFDIVKSYNDYKMFVVPEEAIGLPGIGFVEGMACGAAFVGLRDPMYSDLGLIDGKNYIGYDGTLEDMIAKIAYYQRHEKELAIISENGYNLVRDKFAGPKVSKDFIEELKKQIKKDRFSIE
jgi:glycosyltransferase involved in cell wall biosynthesis